MLANISVYPDHRIVIHKLGHCSVHVTSYQETLLYKNFHLLVNIEQFGNIQTTIIVHDLNRYICSKTDRHLFKNM